VRIGIGIGVFLVGLTWLLYRVGNIPPEMGGLGVIGYLIPALLVIVLGLGIFAWGPGNEAQTSSD
jgi:apolipoprotein N-acyltransferase